MALKRNHTILITGARKGLGKALAQHFASLEYTVVGASRQACDWQCEGYLDFPTDVSNEAAVVDLFRWVRKQGYELVGVINNAAIASMNAALLTPGSSIKAMMDINATGTFLVAREAAKLMRKTGGGHILNLSSVAVSLQLEGQAGYAASKAALEMLTHVLAKEFSEYEIAVNALRLPPLDTGMTRGVPKEKLDKILHSLSYESMPSLASVCKKIEKIITGKVSRMSGKVLNLKDDLDSRHG